MFKAGDIVYSNGSVNVRTYQVLEVHSLTYKLLPLDAHSAQHARVRLGDTATFDRSVCDRVLLKIVDNGATLDKCLPDGLNFSYGADCAYVLGRGSVRKVDFKGDRYNRSNKSPMDLAAEAVDRVPQNAPRILGTSPTSVVWDTGSGIQFRRRG